MAIKTILRLDQEQLPPKELLLANELEILLRPSSLEDRIRTYVLSGSRHSLDVADDEFDGDVQRFNSFLRSLGDQLANAPDCFDLLSHDLAVTLNYRSAELAVGYYHGNCGNNSLWKTFAGFYDVPAGDSNQLRFLRGWLGACFDDNPKLGNELLDSFLTHPIYSHYFITLQSAVPWSNDAWTRVKLCIDGDLVPVTQYSFLLFAGRNHFFSDMELSYMVDRLTAVSGHSFIIAALHDRFILNRSILGHPDRALVDAASRYFTRSNWFLHYKENRDYDFANAQTIEALWVLTNATLNFAELLKNIVDAVLEDRFSLDWFRYSLTMVVMEGAQSVLDSFLLDTVFYTWCKKKLYIYDFQRSEHLLNNIGDSELIEWADKDSAFRYPILFATISLDTQISGKIQWRDFVVVALSVESIVTVLVEMLNDYIFLNPSLEAMKRMFILVKDLEEFRNADVANWAAKAGQMLLNKIQEGEDWIQNRNQFQEEEAFE